MLNWFKDNRRFVIFLIGFGFFRLAIADWNPIPSGSMRPTILEGDVVLVNRLAYDLKVPLTEVSLAHTGEPQRGDVVVFMSPKDGVRLIKRLVGLPGDVIALRDNALYVNGQLQPLSAVSAPVPEPSSSAQPSSARPWAIQATESLSADAHTLPHAHRLQFLPEQAAMRDVGPLTVPPNQYFFLGDNRDNSADSRYIGMVPREKLVGRAHHILASADVLSSWWPRWARFGQGIE